MNSPPGVTTIATLPSADATYDRARRRANISLWAVALQRRRLETTEPEDKDFVFRRWADFDYLLVSLTRLRRAACLAATIPELQTQLNLAIAAFDTALPGLKNMRDVAEHLDDYARGKGRKETVRRQELEVSSLEDDNKTLNWIGHSLNADTALDAGQKLLTAIQDALPNVPRCDA
jgi:hypothetical protein